MVTSKPRTPDKDQLVSLNVWTSSPQSWSQSSSSPLAVYAEVMFGQEPVNNASVFLQVEVEKSDGSTLILPSTLMIDNGFEGSYHLESSLLNSQYFSEPDLSAGEEIYSTLLT